MEESKHTSGSHLGAISHMGGHGRTGPGRADPTQDKKHKNKDYYLWGSAGAERSKKSGPLGFKNLCFQHVKNKFKKKQKNES